MNFVKRIYQSITNRMSSLLLRKRKPGTPSTPSWPALPVKLRILKVNNINAFLGNTAVENARLQYGVDKGCNVLEFYGLHNVFGNSVKQNQLAAFLTKARNVYGIQWLSPIMGSPNGNVNAVNYNLSRSLAVEQFNIFNYENEFWFGKRVQFTFSGAVVAGTVYTITLNGTPYSKTAVGGDTNASIAAAIFALMPAVTWAKTQPSSTVIEIWANSVDVPFTHAVTGPINIGIINYTRAEWLDQMDQLKALTAPHFWYTSAYVQNYKNSLRWNATHAARMIRSIDIYQGTVYTVAPDATRLIESQLYLLADALAASPAVKPVQMYVDLESAEPIYLGPYLAANGLNTSETVWNAQEAAYIGATYVNRAKMLKKGTCYFDHANLSTYLP